MKPPNDTMPVERNKSENTECEDRTTQHSSPDQKQRKQQSKYVKNYRKWFVLFAGFVLALLSVGIVFQLPVIYVELIDEFGTSNAETSLVQAVYVGIFYGSGIFSGLLVTKCGIPISGSIGGILVTTAEATSFFAVNVPYLVATMGVLAGFGSSITYVSATTCVGQHFPGKGKPLALSFVSFGAGIGSIIFPYLTKHLVNIYGWRGTLLFIGGMTLNLVPASLVCVKETVPNKITTNQDDISIKTATEKENLVFEPEQRNETTEGVIHKGGNKPNKSIKKTEIIRGLKVLIKNKVFILFIVGITLFLSGANCFWIFVIDLLEARLDSPSTVSVILMLTSASTVTRFLPGVLKRVPHVSVMSVLAMFAAIGSVTVSLFSLARDYAHFMLIGSFYGIALGGTLSGTAIATIKLVGVEYYSTGIGALFTVNNIGAMVAGPIAGKMRDITGSYDLMLYTVASSLGCACVVFTILTFWRKKRRLGTLV